MRTKWTRLPNGESDAKVGGWTAAVRPHGSGWECQISVPTRVIVRSEYETETAAKRAAVRLALRETAP